MRYNRMSKSAEKALSREMPEGREERRIETARRAALRASWLDQRSHSGRHRRTAMLKSYNTQLRSHLRRFHPEVDLPEDDWQLDEIHERVHDRG